MNSKLYMIVGVIVLIGIGGYLLNKNMPGYSQPTSTSTNSKAVAPTNSSATANSSEAMIAVANDPKLGNILVGNNGMTLYVYTKDSPDTVACTGQCLTNWPPLVTQGKPVLGKDVNPAMVGTAQLPDGSKIVTYNHHPLYYWINDKQPGDVTGQNVGGIWFVVSPDGNMINK